MAIVSVHRVERAAAEAWIRSQLGPIKGIEVTHERAWATVWRVTTSHAEVVWFKACAPVQGFEPYLTRHLFERWADRVTEVLAVDEARSWLLLGDAGTRLNDEATWLEVLPRYAELQRGEAVFAEHLAAHGVADMRLAGLPARYATFVRRWLPISRGERNQLISLEPRFGAACQELAAFGIPETIQHDDLHMHNVYVSQGKTRVLDWGDSSIAHPFFSLVVTFRFVEDRTWHPRLRDAYLEPFGRGVANVFERAIRVGWFAHCIAWLRQRDALPEQARPDFDKWFAVVLRLALQAAEEANW